jgi:hypothetical protein
MDFVQHSAWQADLRGDITLPFLGLTSDLGVTFAFYEFPRNPTGTGSSSGHRSPGHIGTVQLCCKAALGDRSPVRMATTLLIDEVPGMWTLGALGFRESSTAGTAAHRTFFSFEQHRS